MGGNVVKFIDNFINSTSAFRSSPAACIHQHSVNSSTIFNDLSQAKTCSDLHAVTSFVSPMWSVLLGVII